MSEHAINYEEQIKRLSQLQQVDGELLKLVERRGKLPLIIEDLTRDMLKVKAKKEMALQRIQDYQKAIETQQKKSQEAQAKVQQYEKKTKDTKSQQELDLLMEDIELQKIETLLCEKRIKEHGNIILVEENKVRLLEEDIQEKESSIANKKTLLSEIDKENQKQRESLEKKRKTIYKHVVVETYGLYEQVMSTYKNAVVDLLDQACGGCNVMVPLQLQAEVEARKKIHVCPYCSRILAYVKQSQKKKKVRRRSTRSADLKKMA